MRRLINKFLIAVLTVCSRLCLPRGSIFMLHHVSNQDGEFNISPTKLSEILQRVSHKAIKIDDFEYRNDFYIFTIDDVSEDFYLNGFPLFEKYQVPFTIFVCTDLLDQDGYISTAQLKEMSLSPLCTVGSHGISHGYFRHKDKQEVLEEFKRSKEILEAITGNEVEYFAFPYGSFYACGFMNKKYVLQYYKAGFSTIPASIGKFKILPLYFLPRINLTKTIKL